MREDLDIGAHNPEPLYLENFATLTEQKNASSLKRREYYHRLGADVAVACNARNAARAMRCSPLVRHSGIVKVVYEFTDESSISTGSLLAWTN
jgi:hypothetical protein